MGIFNRNKSSKSSMNGDQSSTNGSLGRGGSTPSIKSPLPGKGGNGPLSPGPLAIPEIAIPRPPDPHLDPAAYLRSIHAVRDRTKWVFTKAKRNQLNHFDVDMSKFRDTADYVVSIIKVRRPFLLCGLSFNAKRNAARLCTRLQINPSAR